jgi:VIT1/CCC1 family predicted Fe2+/Mn2+ transporter
MSTTSSFAPSVPTLSHDTEKQAKSTSPSLSSHHEHHSTTPEYLSAAVLGMADGLTVPFALTAGLSSLNSSKLVIIGGLAEVFSGMLSMGLGEYLSSSTRAKQWDVEYARETKEVREMPEAEEEEIYEIFEPFGIERRYVQPIVERLKKDEKAWVDVSSSSPIYKFLKLTLLSS